MIPRTPLRPSRAASAVARRCPGTILLALFLSLLNLQCCQATLLRIDTTVNLRVDVTGKALLAEIVASNSGEETAFHLQMRVTTAGRTQSSPIIEQLPVQGHFTFRFPFPLSSLSPGRYPFVTVISYMDANQYPFSAPTLTAFTHGESSFPDLFPSVSNLKISRRRSLPVTVMNYAEREQSCTVWLLLPKEIHPYPNETRLRVPPLSKKVAWISLENFSALPGSTYPVFAVVEYNVSEKHQTSFASATIQVEEERRLAWLRVPLLAAAALLIALGVYLNKRHAGQKRRS